MGIYEMIESLLTSFLFGETVLDVWQESLLKLIIMIVLVLVIVGIIKLLVWLFNIILGRWL